MWDGLHPRREEVRRRHSLTPEGPQSAARANAVPGSVRDNPSRFGSLLQPYRVHCVAPSEGGPHETSHGHGDECHQATRTPRGVLGEATENYAEHHQWQRLSIDLRGLSFALCEQASRLFLGTCQRCIGPLEARPDRIPVLVRGLHHARQACRHVSEALFEKRNALLSCGRLRQTHDACYPGGRDAGPSRNRPGEGADGHRAPKPRNPPHEPPKCPAPGARQTSPNRGSEVRGRPGVRDERTRSSHHHARPPDDVRPVDRTLHGQCLSRRWRHSRAVTPP